MKAPFDSEKEYREYKDKEAYIDEWAKHVFMALYPHRDINRLDNGDIFEGRDGLVINYYYHDDEHQECIPLSCLWLEKWEKLMIEHDDKERRKRKEKGIITRQQEEIDIETGERALLAELLKKYEVSG